MEDIVIKGDLDSLSKSEILFALGKAYEDIKDYKKAAQSIKEANRLKYSHKDYDKNNTLKTFEKIISFFDREYYEKYKDKGYKYSKAIFIVGMPRSGSSLIEQILSSHSKITGLGELTNFSDEMSALGIGKNDIEELKDLELTYFNQLGENYINSVEKSFTIDNFFIDKALIFDKIGFIKLALPHAKIIHCKRSRNDQILSIYKNKFEKDYHSYAYNEEYLNDYYTAYEKLLNNWEEILGKNFITIDYENLIENPETEISKMLKFIELDWEESCLKFYENKRFVNTISSLQVKKPLYNSSIDKWKNYEDYFPNLFKTKS